jgi:branched-chain amino acid transport system substrate-binding protein
MAFSPAARQARRGLLIGLGCAALVLAGCQARGPRRPAPEIPPGELPPGYKHQVALVVPLTGEDGGIGTSISNAARLALLDTGNQSIELRVYNSADGGAASAATKAIADGNRLILGPLLAEDVRAAAPVARQAGVPVIAFSNDEGVAGNGVFILGFTPQQSIDRVVRHARAQGATRFGGLIPMGLYGQRAATALAVSVHASGGRLVGLENFNRSAAGVRTAANALNAKGPVDAVLIADSGRIAALAAPSLRAGSRLLGTELWASERTLGQTARLRGAWYAAAPDARFNQLVTRYRARYGKTPYRLGSLGYDAVLLTVRAARSWPAGRPFPARTLVDRDGFAGVDGIFRFGRDGVAERSLEVRQVTAAGTTPVSPAAVSFGN